VLVPKRCARTFSEFTLKELEKDKEGNWINEIPDGNDRSIDAVRYAMMDDVLRG
jgi:phage terminase large subunit